MILIKKNNNSEGRSDVILITQYFFRRSDFDITHFIH